MRCVHMKVRTLITQELRRMWAPFSSWVFFLLNIRQPRTDYLKRSFFLYSGAKLWNSETYPQNFNKQLS